MNVFTYDALQSSSQRPSNRSSRHLSQNENELLHDILGNDCVTLATAVAQLLFASNNSWKKHACGVWCFIKDYKQRIYCLRLYDLRSKQSIYEEIITPSVRLNKVQDAFYTFSGVHCTVGINFVDSIEAQIFCNLFHEKRESRQTKKTSCESGDFQQTRPAKDITVSSISTPTFNKNVNSKSSNRRLKKSKKPVISGPDPSSFELLMSVKLTQSVINTENAQQRELFQKILSGMKLPGNEKLYLWKTIGDDNVALGKFLADSVDQNDDDSILNSPMDTTSCSHSGNAKNDGKRVPHQDISLPSSIYQITRKNHPQLQIKFSRSSISTQRSTRSTSTLQAVDDESENIHPTIHISSPSPSASTSSPNNHAHRSPAPPPPKSTNFQNLPISPPSAPPSNPVNSQNTPARSPAPRPPPISTNFQKSDIQSPLSSPPNSVNSPKTGIRSPPPPPPPKPTNIHNNNIRSPVRQPPPIPTSLQNTGDHSQPTVAPSMPANLANTAVQSPPPPPPPMPSNLQNMNVSTSSSSTPNILPEQIASDCPTTSTDPSRNCLLTDICNFDQNILKPAPQRVLTKKFSYQEKLRELLLKRREDIIGNADDDEESDSNDSDWE